MLCVFGMSHKTASLAVLNDFYLDIQKQEQLHDRLRERVNELVILQTCNRWECYASVDYEAEQEILDAVRDHFDVPADRIDQYLFFKRGEECIYHLLEVSASLDSLILGESQILGQVKCAYFKAREQGWSGKLLNRLFEIAVKGGKRVRTETGISRGAVSISQAAVELGKKICGDLSESKVLVIGAGEMGLLACRHLVSAGCKNIFMMNRTLSKAQKICDLNGWKPLGLEHLTESLFEVDMVISAVATSGYIVELNQMRNWMKERRFRTLALIDISLPRSLDPSLGELPKVFLYGIEDLKNIVNENVQERQRQIARAREIISDELRSFLQWCSQQDLIPAVKSIGKWKEEVILQEIEKWIPKISSPLISEDRVILQRFADSLANKLLHLPIRMLKEGAEGQEDRERTLKVVDEVVGGLPTNDSSN